MNKRLLMVSMVMMVVMMLSGTALAQVNLEFWIIEPFTSDPDAAIYEAVEIFNEQNPDINVEINPIPAVDIKDTYVTAAFGGGGPDVATLDSAWQGELAEMGLLADITTQFAPIRDDFFDGPARTGIVRNKTYSVPWYTNNVAFFYNMDLLEKAGYEEPPADWDEFVDMAVKLKEIDKYAVTMGDGSFMPFTYLPFLYSAGGKIVDNNGPRFHDEAGLEAFKFVTDLYTEYEAMSDGAINAASWSELYAPFHHGEAAVTITGDWGIYPLKQAEVDFEWKIGNPPAHPETGNVATVLGGYNLAINPNSDHFEESWKFIEFLSSEDNMWVLQYYNRIPALEAVLDTPYAKEDPLMEIFFEQAAIAVPRAPVPQYYASTQILGDYFEEVLFGRMTAEEALETAAEEVKDELF